MSIAKCMKCKRVLAIPKHIANKEEFICEDCVPEYLDKINLEDGK